MAILYEIDDIVSRIPGINKLAVNRGSRSIGEGYSAHVDDRDFLEVDVTSNTSICICLRIFFDDPVGIGSAEVRAICLRVKCNLPSNQRKPLGFDCSKRRRGPDTSLASYSHFFKNSKVLDSRLLC